MSPIAHALARTRTRTIARLFALSLAIVAARPIAAQSTDSLPFRARQWGAEFSASSGFGSAGLLRFHTSRRALLLDAGGTITRQSKSDAARADNSAAARLRIGERFYRPVARRVVQFATVGVGASHDDATTSVPTFTGTMGEQTQRQWATGVFGGVGAAWMVTPALSLGATYEAELNYVSSTTEVRRIAGDDLNAKQHSVVAHVGDVALRVTLFF